MPRKDSKETFRAFLTMITEKKQRKQIWVDKGTEFAGEFKKISKAEGTQIYCTMSETNLHLLNVQNGHRRIYSTVI